VNEIKIENHIYFDQAYQQYILKSTIYYMGKFHTACLNIKDIMFKGVFDEAWKLMGEELKQVLQHERMVSK
jgi:hypothetical protein